MGKIWTLLGAVGLLLLLAQPTWAGCLPRIREGRELLKTAKLAKADEDKVKALLDQAQKYFDAGDHGNGVPTANQALDLLKKK
jgi:hypothetical protein